MAENGTDGAPAGDQGAGSAGGTNTGDGTTTTETIDWKARAEAAEADRDSWKDQARKHEGRAKQNQGAARELENLKRNAMSDAEAAIADAEKRIRGEVTKEVGGKLVDAHVRTALAGRPNANVDALLEGLDRTRFLTEDGDPDAKAIGAWADKVAPLPEGDGNDGGAGTGPLGQQIDLGQGGNGANARALNGDPLLRDLERAVGAQPQQ